MAEKKPKLHVVTAGNSSIRAQPPRKLGKSGQALWDAVQSEYAVEDIGGVELLAQCCEALDRVQNCRCQIDRDGELIKTKTGLREHPLLKHELQARAFLVRCISRLGIDVEALRSGPGRPPGAVGYVP